MLRILFYKNFSIVSEKTIFSCFLSVVRVLTFYSKDIYCIIFTIMLLISQFVTN